MESEKKSKKNLWKELERRQKRISGLTKELEGGDLPDSLNRGENWHRMLVESMTDGIVMADERGVFQYVNDRFCEMIGYEREEVLGKRVTDAFRILGKGDQKTFSQELEKRKKGKEASYELGFKRKDGKEAFVMVSPKPIFDKEGRFKGALGVITDITRCKNVENTLKAARDKLKIHVEDRTKELKAANKKLQEEILAGEEAKEALQESELWMRRIFDSLQEAVFVITSDRALVNMNEAAIKMFGYSKQELIDLSTEVLHVDHGHYKEFGRRIHEFFDRGQTADFLFEAKRKNGAIFPTEHTVSLLKDNDGQAIGIVSVVRDITERKRAKAALRESEERFRILVEGIKDYAIFMLDPEGNVLNWNKGAERIKGYGPTDIIGRHFSIFYSEEDIRRKKPDAVLKEAVRKGSFREEGWRLRKDGSRFWADALITALKNDDGMIIGFSKVTGDMTEKKRLEEEQERLLEQLDALNLLLEKKIKERTADMKRAVEAADAANRAKSDLMASMSHELRTPLNAILGFSTVLQDQYFGELNAKQADYVSDILESGRHLLSLINDILDLSKVEAGRMDLELSRIKIRDLLENSTTVVKEKAYNHGIGVTVQIADELKALEIQADERKLKQIMFNLLSNAVKFTPDGGSVRVSARRISDCEMRNAEFTKEGKIISDQSPTCNPQSAIEISVADSGIGIPPEDHERIFGEFYQVKGGLTDKTPGTGLGLSLTKKLVEMHGGRVWVESEGEGKGSRFSFTLPEKHPALEWSPAAPKAGAPEIGMKPEEIFQNHLDRVLDISKRKNRPFSLARFHVRMERLKEKEGAIEGILDRGTRTYDFLGTDQDGYLYLILQETDRNGARIACDRFAGKLERLFGGKKISFSLATFPEDGGSAKALLGKVRAGGA